jgi:hypothetical protein
MILKYFRQKIDEILAFFIKSYAKNCAITLVSLRNMPIFHRKFAKIAQNRGNNIDPRNEHFKVWT